MSDYYSRESGFDALCRIMAERKMQGKPITITMPRHNGETAIKKSMCEYRANAEQEFLKHREEVKK